MDDSKLIELVREHFCVFNPKHYLYKDANVRDNVWKEIAVKMKLPGEECKSRWKNIRDTYMRRKRSKKLPTGSASSKKLRKWHLEDYLEFMNVVDCERETVTNTITQDETLNFQPAEVPVYSEFPDPDILDFDEDIPEEPKQSNGGSDGVPRESKKRKPTTKLSGDNILKVFKMNADERTKMMSTMVEKHKETHPIDIFFQSMAMTVKKFSPQNQIRAGMEVCQIVSQLELEELNRAKNDVPQFDTSSSNSNSHSSTSTFLPPSNRSEQFGVGPSTSFKQHLTIQSPSLLDDGEEYEFTILTNTSDTKF